MSPRQQRESPRILVQIGSAGIDPWLSLEMLAQRHLLQALQHPAVTFVWLRPKNADIGSRGLRFLGEYEARRRNWMVRPNWLSRKLRKMDWNRGPLIAPQARFARKIMEQEMQCRRYQEVDEHTIQFGYPRDSWLVSARIAPQLQFALANNRFTHIFRTTSTSLVNPQALVRWCADLGNTGVYAGHTIDFMDGLRFVSGSSQLLSRDVASLIVEHRSSLRLDLYDDVAVGRLLSELGIRPMEHIAEVQGEDLIRNQAESLDPDRTLVVRCKPRDWSGDVYSAVKLMEAVGPTLLHSEGQKAKI